MKQFNLEEYLKNPSQKVVTRDGRNVRIICTDAKFGKFPIVGLVFSEEQAEEETYNFMENGKFFPDQDWFLDLFFAPTKREGWINLYWSIGGDKFVYPGGTIYKSKEEAMNNNNLDYITSVKVEWEE